MFDVSKHVVDTFNTSDADKVIVHVDRLLTNGPHLKDFFDETIESAAAYSEKQEGSMFKHHFLLAETRNFYITAEYCDSSNVHVRVSNNMRFVMQGRRCAERNHNIYPLSRDMVWFFKSCKNFTDEDFSKVSHNCKDFVSHMKFWLT